MLHGHVHGHGCGHHYHHGCWNTHASGLCDRVGRHPLTEWIAYRVSRPELSALARSADDVHH